MKKYLPILVFCFLLLTSASVSALPVEITVEPREQAGQPYSLVKFSMKITNNQDADDSFQIIFSGPHLEWIMPSRIAQGVQARSSEEIEIVLYPTGQDAGIFDYRVTVRSLKDPEARASETFSVSIPYDARVKSFTASASGSTVNFNLVLQTAEQKILSGTFAVKDSSGKTIRTAAFQETVAGEKAIAKSLTGERLLAGTYTAQAEIKNTSAKAAAAFTVQPVRNVVKTVEETSSGMVREVTISLRNEGNVVERDYSLQESTPIDFMTGLMTKPPGNCREGGGALACDYVISEIRPGATAHVTYTASYWPAFNGYALLIITAISLALYSFLRATTPRILKRHSRKGEDRHISIHIKNPFFHNLKDVVVRDQVSPLAQVLHEEVEPAKPMVRSMEEGTELIWKLGEMKPREERILQYKVRPLIHGSLKMPKARMKFTTGRGEKKIRLSSKGITLD